MIISNYEILLKYRADAIKEQKVDDFCPKISLFGVSRKLDKPVIAFTKISKKYLYDAEGNKYPFRYCLNQIESAPVIVFTTESEAWKFFKDKAIERWEIAQDFFATELKIVKLANNIIAEKAKDFPEYFI
jgi:hypothetical protein